MSGAEDEAGAGGKEAREGCPNTGPALQGQKHSYFMTRGFRAQRRFSVTFFFCVSQNQKLVFCTSANLYTVFILDNVPFEFIKGSY